MEASPHPAAGGAPPAWARVMQAVAPWIGITGFGVATIVQLAQDGTAGWEAEILKIALTWLVGVWGVVYASGHIFFPDPIADSIGWPRGNPFQFEVGIANLALGVIGLMASSFGRDFWLAVVVAYAVFMYGAAAGHVREMVRRKNFAPGNAGSILFFDLAIPTFLIILYVLSG